LKDLVLFAE